LKEITSQFHAPVTLHSGKELPAPSSRRLQARQPVWTMSERSEPV